MTLSDLIKYAQDNNFPMDAQILTIRDGEKAEPEFSEQSNGDSKSILLW